MTFAELSTLLHAHEYTLCVRFVETHYVARLMLAGKAVGAGASNDLGTAIKLAFDATKLGGVKP